MKNNQTYCEMCNDITRYEVKKENREFIFKGRLLKIEEELCICKVCGMEVHVGERMDSNLKKRDIEMCKVIKELEEKGLDFCHKCQEDREYRLEKKELEENGVKYEKEYVYCKECGGRMYVDKVNKRNKERLENIIRG